MPKQNTAEIIKFPEPPGSVAPIISAMAEAMAEAMTEEGLDLNLYLTLGQTGCTLHQLPEGLRLDGPDGEPIWRLYKVTD